MPISVQSDLWLDEIEEMTLFSIRRALIEEGPDYLRGPCGRYMCDLVGANPKNLWQEWWRLKGGIAPEYTATCECECCKNWKD